MTSITNNLKSREIWCMSVVQCPKRDCTAVGYINVTTYWLIQENKGINTCNIYLIESTTQILQCLVHSYLSSIRSCLPFLWSIFLCTTTSVTFDSNFLFYEKTVCSCQGRHQPAIEEFIQIPAQTKHMQQSHNTQLILNYVSFLEYSVNLLVNPITALVFAVSITSMQIYSTCKSIHNIICNSWLATGLKLRAPWSLALHLLLSSVEP